jgi:hypothetical protein
MKKDLFENIKKSIEAFRESIQSHLPALEAEVNELIQSASSNKVTIENTLDTLLSITDIGIGKDLFVKLLEYYKTIDAEGAAFYWNEFDKEEE